MSETETIGVDVISDVVCPWCFVGKRRLEGAIALRPDLAVERRWRPYQLDPTIPPGGVDRQEYLTKKFGPGGVAAAHERLVAIGRELGIPFAFDRIKRSPNTLDAHRVIRWAMVEDRQDALVERLFALYFCEGADIGDHAVLATAAGEAGLNAEAVRARLATDEDVEAIRQDIAVAQQIGVQGVPFFIFDGRLAASGAQPEQTLASAMDQALAARAKG